MLKHEIGEVRATDSVEVDAIVAELSAHAATIEAADLWDMHATEVRALHDAIVAVLDRAAASLNRSSLEKFLSRQELRERLIRLNARLHSVTEVGLTKRYLANSTQKDPFEGSWINRGFTDLLAGQIAQWRRCGANVAANRKIAIVGGGALPQTQVFLARALGCATVSVERDAEAAELSREVLVRARVSDATVALADGCEFDFEGCAIVVVATLVQQKSAIAAQVARSALRAVYAPRTAVGTHAMWREAVDTTTMQDTGWALLDVWTPEGSTVASQAYRQRST